MEKQLLSAARSALGSVFHGKKKSPPKPERREAEGDEASRVAPSGSSAEQESRDDRVELMRELERLEALRHDLLQEEGYERQGFRDEEEALRKGLKESFEEEQQRSMPAVVAQSDTPHQQQEGDLQLHCPELCSAEHASRWALEDEQQTALEAICTWMDGLLDQDELLVLQAEERASRSSISEEADWSSDMLARATALQRMAQSERRLALVRAEARARAALAAGEAAQRETYARVLRRWALEGAECVARQAILADCDRACLAVLRAAEVGAELLRLRFLEREAKARQALLKGEVKERSTLESRASTELTARQVWWFQTEELQAREAIQKAQMAAWASLRQCAEREQRLALLVEAEVRRRTSLLQEPAHFWQQVDARLALDAQRQRGCLQACHEGAQALRDAEATEWRRLGDAFAAEWAYLCATLFHWALQAEWDGRDAIEDEEDDVFEELLSGLQDSQAEAEQRAVLREEVDSRNSIFGAEQSVRCDLLLDFNDMPRPIPRAQTPSMIHIRSPGEVAFRAKSHRGSVAASSPMSSAGSSAGGALSSVASTPSFASAGPSPAASDGVRRLSPRQLAPLLGGRMPKVSPSAGFEIPSPVKPAVAKKMALKAVKAPRKLPLGGKAGHRQRLTEICEGLLSTMEEVLQADSAAMRLPPISCSNAAQPNRLVAAKRRQLDPLPFAAREEEGPLRLPPLSPTSSVMTPMCIAIPSC
eukprot:EG_transcript_3767